MCTRCKQVQMENMAEFCKCSGAFRTRESAADFKRSLRVFKNVAEYYDFPWLAEAVRFILLR